MKIELFSTPGCSRCAQASTGLKVVLAAFGEGRVIWRDVNLLDEIDYAVKLGLISPSAIAIDGELVFPSLPDAAALRAEIVKRLR
ncbi:MAG: glutaredoxin [Paraburkholderia sp.]|nr:MAG: glutaredoxin [Paraburkholderia sp.]